MSQFKTPNSSQSAATRPPLKCNRLPVRSLRSRSNPPLHMTSLCAISKLQPMKLSGFQWTKWPSLQGASRASLKTWVSIWRRFNCLKGACSRWFKPLTKIKLILIFWGGNWTLWLICCLKIWKWRPRVRTTATACWTCKWVCLLKACSSVKTSLRRLGRSEGLKESFCMGSICELYYLLLIEIKSK